MCYFQKYLPVLIFVRESNTLIETLTSNLSTCSIAPQSSTLPCAPTDRVNGIMRLKCSQYLIKGS
jgi:hypothetical protein